MMVEANYSLKILIEKYGHGDVAEMLKNRIIISHFEFENAKEFYPDQFERQAASSLVAASIRQQQ